MHGAKDARVPVEATTMAGFGVDMVGRIRGDPTPTPISDRRSEHAGERIEWRFIGVPRRGRLRAPRTIPLACQPRSE